MQYSPAKELIKFLKPYDPAVRKLALGLRALVLEELAPCYENIYDAYSAVAMGYGPTDRMRDGICHIAVYSSHVNLGFNFGATLADPDGILEGSGNQIRHVTINTQGDLTRPELRSYLRPPVNQRREESIDRQEAQVVKPGENDIQNHSVVDVMTSLNY